MNIHHGRWCLGKKMVQSMWRNLLCLMSSTSDFSGNNYRKWNMPKDDVAPPHRSFLTFPLIAKAQRHRQKKITKKGWIKEKRENKKEKKFPLLFIWLDKIFGSWSDVSLVLIVEINNLHSQTKLREDSMTLKKICTEIGN